jgi:beta-fructofuranosidase
MTRREFAAALAAPALLNAAQGGNAREFFYRPENAWAADFIPFYDNGKFHLFYLLDWRDKAGHGEGTPWYQIETEDFVHFKEYGEMLPRGTEQQQDLYVFTGSVLKANGKYHIFYTGHNEHMRPLGKPVQGVMHAVSSDLVKWTKVPGDTFFAPEARYEPHDWRDPFVFWNPEAGEFWMLVAARFKTGPSRRRGCTALCASKDLKSWEVREPFWSPGLYYTHECPDLFKMGDWWYLIYSTFTERSVTHYRMSRSLKGPWIAPENDTFDGRAYYAAKTASDGERRFAFGWLATREDRKDYNQWNWGGNLVVHEVVQQKDGSLTVKMPESVERAFAKSMPVQVKPGFGTSRIEGARVTIPAVSGFACATAGAMPDRCKIEATVKFEKNTRGCGVMLRSSADFDAGYYVRLEPGRDRLVLDSWPRQGDVPFMVELERPLELEPGKPVHLKILVDGTSCVVYAAGTLAMSARLYNHAKGDWGVFVSEGSAEFRDLSLATS